MRLVFFLVSLGLGLICISYLAPMSYGTGITGDLVTPLEFSVHAWEIGKARLIRAVENGV